MSSTTELFEQINNAVLDLQGAQFQTFERPLKQLARLLDHPDLIQINSKLTDGLDLNSFLSSQERKGGMVGSDRLDWPEDPEQVMGINLLLIQKFAAKPDDLFQFGHHYFYGGNKAIGAIHNVVGQMIIPFIRDYKIYVMNRGTARPVHSVVSSNKIFIVHGHDGEALQTTARFLEKLGFDAIILHEQANKGRTIIEKVEAEGDVGFAVVLLTPDDEGCVKGGTPEARARQNVILELGYFLGRLGRSRVSALKRGSLNIPSDFAGVVWTEMDEANGWKIALAKELDAASYVIDWKKVIT